LSEELDKLEEVLEKKTKEELYGGILPIPRSSSIERILNRLGYTITKIEMFLSSSANVPKVRGALFGVSLLVALGVSTIDLRVSIILLVFFILLHFLFYPDMVFLVGRFLSHVIYDLLKKGTIASILTPKEIVDKLRATEYVLYASIPLLFLSFLNGGLIIAIFRIIGIVVLVVSAITYYYLSTALECWENPTREIRERDVLSWRFFFLVLVFVSASISLYTMLPPKFSSLFGWVLTVLSYALVSTIIAVPSFQAALHVTTLWRGIDTRKLFEEIERSVRWMI